MLEQARLIYGVDVLDGLHQLESESVHTCITSPPYWRMRDYGVEGQIGLEETPELFIEKLVAVFREVRRVLRKDGTIWVNMGDSYSSNSSGGKSQSGFHLNRSRAREAICASNSYRGNGIKPKDLIGQPWMLAFALRADGWYLRSDIIWAKPNPMPESVTDRPTKAHEYLFLLSKSPNYFYDAEAIREAAVSTEAKKWHDNGSDKQSGHSRRHAGFNRRYAEKIKLDGVPTVRNKRTVWEIPTAPYPEAHYATFPTDLVMPCILAGTSTHGVCSECGSPWERVVEKIRSERSNFSKARRPAVKGWDPGPGRHDKLQGRYERPKGKGTANGQDRENHDIRNGPCVETKTIGWKPTCKHADSARVPATVLDPFSGSATTGEVAIGLGRRYIGIELNQQNMALAKKRLGLFACAVNHKENQ